jgi:hypothetical protein
MLARMEVRAEEGNGLEISTQRRLLRVNDRAFSRERERERSD